MTVVSAPVAADGLGHGVEHGYVPKHRLTALAGCRPATMLVPYACIWRGVEQALAAR